MKTVEQLQAEEAERRALQEAIRKIEGLAGNDTYQQAWRRCVKVLREMVLIRS